MEVMAKCCVQEKVLKSIKNATRAETFYVASVGSSPMKDSNTFYVGSLLLKKIFSPIMLEHSKYVPI